MGDHSSSSSVRDTGVKLEPVLFKAGSQGNFWHRYCPTWSWKKAVVMVQRTRLSMLFMGGMKMPGDRKELWRRFLEGPENFPCFSSGL